MIVQFYCYCFLHVKYIFLRLWDYATPRTPEECLMCYQTSQHNWVIINMLNRYLQRSLLGWHRSRLGFVTPSIREVSLAPLSNADHNKPCKQCDNELVAGWCITKWVKRLAGNEIELGMKIPTIESRASNIPMTKGTTYIVLLFDR